MDRATYSRSKMIKYLHDLKSSNGFLLGKEGIPLLDAKKVSNRPFFMINGPEIGLLFQKLFVKIPKVFVALCPQDPTHERNYSSKA